MFDGGAISSIREKLGCKASRVEAVTAVIWKAFICLTLAKQGNIKTFLSEHAVNLRGRTIPPMPRNTFGNFITIALSQIPRSDTNNVELNDLVKAMHNEVGNCMNKELHSEEFFEMASNSLGYTVVENPNEVDFRMFTSWSRVAFYEADFGWGKPCWISSMCMDVERIFLIDTKDGDGIEAWISVDEQDMLQLQHDQYFKTFNSYSHVQD